ncbi:MAG: glycoside hydrolase family 127 protein [Kiritimatiellae bacterium]|nr:glycoside hydrolase family 127 protein [Kiritimatiellia bacterium]
MKYLIFCGVLSAALSAQCEVRQVLEPLKPGAIVARGWLKGQLELSLSGMGGHLGEIEPDQMDKPYVTRDFNPANGARGLVGWCAEMGAEYALGTAMLAYTLGDDALVAKAAARIRAAMALQEPDGYLGAYRPGDNRQEDFNAWGCHFFYDAMLNEYHRTGDKAILDAVHRGLLWFVRNWSGENKTDYAGPTIIEPATVVYRLTGDERLLDFCKEYAAWLDKPGHKNGATFTRFPLHRHAYHVAAIAARLKLPVALALAADRRDMLDAAVKMLSDHRDGLGWQATYAPCADGEWTAAPSCVGETEYCDYIYNIEFFQWLVLLTGEIGYADSIERIAFNAAQGARGKDERTIGYMTSPNQWYATRTSSRWGPEPFYGVYAPNVNAACCPANSIRLYPLYVMRAVLREGRDLRVMNYGPYAVRTTVDGAAVSVESETDYPFDGRITLRVRADGWRGALRLRRPAWAESVSVTRNGKLCAVRDEDGVLTVGGPWRKDGETVTVDFGWSPVVREVRDRDFGKVPLKTVEWGALVFAQPVEEVWTPVPRSKPGWGADEAPPQPKEWPWFDVTCRNEPVPYALPQGLLAADIKVVRGETGALPWRKPPVKLIVPMVRASAAYPPESRDGIHTPKPSQGVVAPDCGAEPEGVAFVPFGATCLRTTCFPTAAAKGAEIVWTRVIAQEEGRQCSWPSVAKAADGSIIAVFSGDREAHICPWGKVQMVKSKDGGETWSQPRTIGKTKLDDRDAGIVLLPDGRLFVTWFNSVAYRTCFDLDSTNYPPGSAMAKWQEFDRSMSDAEKRENCGFYGIWSSDNGETWTKPEKLVSLRSQTPHGPVLLKDGSLLQFGRRFDDNLKQMFTPKYREHTTIMAERSTDGGHTWTTLCEKIADATGENDRYTHWMHEPHVAELPNGELYALVRADHAKDVLMRQTRSSDGGKTWEPMTPTGLSGLPPHLLVLSDGRLLAVYGRRTKDRGGLGEYASVSSDGGRTWGCETKLSGSTTWDLGYPASIEVEPGVVLTVYYQPPPTGGKPCIMATKWKVGERK